MIKFVRDHPLLGGVAVLAIISGGLLIWLTAMFDGEVGIGDESSTAATETSQTTTVNEETGAETVPEPDPESPEGFGLWPVDASQTEAHQLRDGVNRSIARLSYSERVDPVASVNAGGHRWILSELPTDTRNRFVDEGLAGPELDPFGGEILLVESETIVRAFPMNEFPPTFLETDGVMVFGGRDGDGGYPDSALVAINSLTLSSARLVFRPTQGGSGLIYDPIWNEGTERQHVDLREGNYLQALNAMTGILPEGDTWVVRDDPDEGLCAAISDIDYGCDASSVFVSEADPAYTPRIIARPVPPEGIDTSEIGVVIYGYLPEDATDVQIRVGGEPLEAESSVNVDLGMWVVPVAVSSEPFTVGFVNESGVDIAEWTDS